MKITYLLFAIIVLILNLNLVSQSTTILNEEFENNTKNWDVGLEEIENSEIKNGKYIMEPFQEKNWHWFAIDVNLNEKEDFLIETNLNKLRAFSTLDTYGLMWGAIDPKNYYAFLINTQDQVFSVSSYFDGNGFKIINWKRSYRINQGNAANKLGVARVGSDLVFLINDEIVDKAPFQEFYGKKIGFYVGPKIKLAADNLLVRQSNASMSDDSATNQNLNWKGNGTGFFIDPTGYIATNYHVVENSSALEIDLIQNGQKKSYKAKVISTDKQNDLAIIKIDDVTFKPYTKLPYNFKTNICDVGSNVFCLGYPMALSKMGVDVKFTDGKISAKTGFQGDITSYQVSVPVQPGNSGGALFDYDGNVIGVINAKIMEADNVSYAIKSTYLKNLIDVLPESLAIPNDKSISVQTLTEKIKVISDYVVLIKVK